MVLAAPKECTAERPLRLLTGLYWFTALLLDYCGQVWDAGIAEGQRRREWGEGGLQDGSPSLSLTYKWNPAVEKKSVV